MINQQEWLRTRRNLLEEVKAQVRVRLGPLSPPLARYAKRLDGDFARKWQSCPLKELGRAISSARVVLGADFHAYSQSQRAHVRLLRDHVSNQKVILALECLPHNREKVARDFIKGRISEAKFLQLINWDKNWGFPWENYRPFFELARERGYSVIGLHNDLPTLEKRDKWTADKIAACRKQNPQSLVYVVIGEWHLAEAHLPRRLKIARDEVMILHQDVERLYFKLAKNGRESSVECLKGGKGRFCLMVSPPWMKWQSYLMYLEQAYDRDLQEELSIDYSEHVVSLIQLLETDLKVETHKSHVQVYSPNSKTSLARLRLILPRKEVKAMLYHLEHDQSFFIPRKDWLYLSRPTINHASSLAGQFVHAQLCRRQSTLWEMPRQFVGLVWVEAVGFFFSKWINPKRKAETLESVRLRLAVSNSKDKGRFALMLTLDHRLSEVLWVKTGRLRRPRLKVRGSDPHFEAARLLGGMLGEKLFQKVRSRTISLTKLMSYLKVNVDDGNFAKTYWQIVREIERDQAL